MGYTHYWSQSRKFTQPEWIAIRKAAQAIVDETDAELCWEYDKPEKPLQIDAIAIRFNGAEDDGHETFMLTRSVPFPPEYRKDEPDFQFCKTARKPYDTPVAAILMATRTIVPDAFEWSSDGWAEEDDMQAAVKLANAACDLGLKITNAEPDENDPYFVKFHKKEQGK